MPENLFEKHKKKSAWAALLLSFQKHKKLLYIMLSLLLLLSSRFMFSGFDFGGRIESVGRELHLPALVRLGESLSLSSDNIAKITDESAPSRGGGGFSMSAYLQESGGTFSSGPSGTPADLVKEDSEMLAEGAGKGKAGKDGGGKYAGKGKAGNGGRGGKGGSGSEEETAGAPQAIDPAEAAKQGTPPVDVSALLAQGGAQAQGGQEGGGQGSMAHALASAFGGGNPFGGDNPGSVAMAKGGGDLFQGSIGALNPRDEAAGRLSANPFGGRAAALGKEIKTGKHKLVRVPSGRLSGAFSRGAKLGQKSGVLNSAFGGSGLRQLLYARDSSVYAAQVVDDIDAHAYAGAGFDGGIPGEKIQAGNTSPGTGGSGVSLGSGASGGAGGSGGSGGPGGLSGLGGAGGSGAGMGGFGGAAPPASVANPSSIPMPTPGPLHGPDVPPPPPPPPSAPIDAVWVAKAEQAKSFLSDSKQKLWDIAKDISLYDLSMCMDVSKLSAAISDSITLYKNLDQIKDLGDQLIGEGQKALGENLKTQAAKLRWGCWEMFTSVASWGVAYLVDHSLTQNEKDLSDLMKGHHLGQQGAATPLKALEVPLKALEMQNTGQLSHLGSQDPQAAAAAGNVTRSLTGHP